jgi:hypothetical protein
VTPERRGALLWIAAGVVVSAEMLVAGLALYPSASAAYQDYYIDRRTDCWPHVTPAAYVPGTALSFIYGQRPDFVANKICGWFYPNEHGTWSYGTYSQLRFVFPAAGGALRLTLNAGAMVNANDPTQRVVVSANGKMLATLNFNSADPQELSLDIPAEMAAASATGLDLRFDYPDARSGSEMGPNEDPHLRAIRMVTLTLGAPA